MKALFIALCMLLTIHPVLAYQQHRDRNKCWSRTYDNDHLAKHPNQIVRKMYLRMFPVTSDNEDEYDGFGIKLYLSVRGVDDYKFVGFALCLPNSKQSTPGIAALECRDRHDGGILIFSYAEVKKDIVQIDLRPYGKFSFYENRNPPDPMEDPAYTLTPGMDDDIFNLNPAMEECKN